MMVPMKEHSILSAGKLIQSVGMSCVQDGHGKMLFCNF